MRVIAFVNKGSGGNEGPRVLDMLKNHLGDENVFDIKADKGPNRGLEARASDASMEVRIVVAGGDGTFSWVASAIEKQNLSHCRLIVLPLGSGNDMARALGWGKKFPGVDRVPDIVSSIDTAKSHRIDVWRLTAVEDESLATPVDDDGLSHGARPLVCNYLSLGADAFVELRFNQLRWERPEKYKSRMGNFRAHALIGVKYMCSQRSKKIFIADHIESLYIDEQLVDIPPHLQAIIFLNIPSYGAGVQPWGVLGGKKPADADKSRVVDDMYVDDHRFEVIGLRSLSHFGRIKALGAHGVRIAQGSRMALKLKSESTPFQVDGEPWEQRGGEVTLEPGNTIGILEGPIWKPNSKKNAKFSPPSDQYDYDDESDQLDTEKVADTDE